MFLAVFLPMFTYNLYMDNCLGLCFFNKCFCLVILKYINFA